MGGLSKIVCAAVVFGADFAKNAFYRFVHFLL